MRARTPVPFLPIGRGAERMASFVRRRNQPERRHSGRYLPISDHGAPRNSGRLERGGKRTGRTWAAPLPEQLPPGEWGSAAPRPQAGRTGVQLPSVTSDITLVMCDPIALALGIRSAKMCKMDRLRHDPVGIVVAGDCVASPLSVHIPLRSECREIRLRCSK